MRRGGTSALKSIEPSQPDIQRVLRFELPNSAREEDAFHHDVHGNEDAWTGDVTYGHGLGSFDVLQVRNYCCFFHFKDLRRHRRHQDCQNYGFLVHTEWSELLPMEAFLTSTSNSFYGY